MQVGNIVFLSEFRVTRPVVGHLCAARNAVGVYGIRMHQLMLGARMKVKQLVFINEFSGDPPVGGSPVRCVQRSGSAWNTNASIHAWGARMQVKQLVFLSGFAGDPPSGGSPGRRAQHSGNVWNTNAPTHVGAQSASEASDFRQRVFG